MVYPYDSHCNTISHKFLRMADSRAMKVWGSRSKYKLKEKEQCLWLGEYEPPVVNYTLRISFNDLC